MQCTQCYYVLLHSVLNSVIIYTITAHSLSVQCPYIMYTVSLYGEYSSLYSVHSIITYLMNTVSLNNHYCHYTVPTICGVARLSMMVGHNIIPCIHFRLAKCSHARARCNIIIHIILIQTKSTL